MQKIITKAIFLYFSGEFHLGYSRNELQGLSWYQLLHWDSTREAQTKHRLSKFNLSFILNLLNQLLSSQQQYIT